MADRLDHPELELTPLYALGALGPDEKARTDAHLARGCEICEAELYLLNEAASRLPLGLAEQPIPVDLKRRLMERIRKEEGSRRSRARAFPAVTFALAAALLLTAGLAAFWRSQGSSHERNLASSRSQAAELRARLVKQEKEGAWLRDPRVQMALLKGLAGAETARARLLWHPETHQGILTVSGLPPLALEKSYELWMFVKDVPVPAGVFDTRPDGTTVFTLSKVDGVTESPSKFAVSVEPRGGVPKPTGAVVLIGDAL